jgi:hypothetical protein
MNKTADDTATMTPECIYMSSQLRFNALTSFAAEASFALSNTSRMDGVGLLNMTNLHSADQANGMCYH